MDVYRAEIEQTSMADHRKFRGNVFETTKLEDNIPMIDSLGRIITEEVNVEDNIYRRNYKKSDNINYLDGDVESQMGINWNDFLQEKMEADTSSVAIDKWNSSKYGGKNGKNVSKYKDNTRTGNSNEMYAYGTASLITDRTRVFKGGSWKDRAYWLNPGSRRFLDEDQATDAIGFRCVMDRLGSQTSTQKQNQRRKTDFGKKAKGLKGRK